MSMSDIGNGIGNFFTNLTRAMMGYNTTIQEEQQKKISEDLGNMYKEFKRVRLVEDYYKSNPNEKPVFDYVPQIPKEEGLLTSIKDGASNFITGIGNGINNAKEEYQEIKYLIYGLIAIVLLSIIKK